MERKRKVMKIIVAVLAVILMALTAGGIWFRKSMISVQDTFVRRDTTSITITTLSGEDMIILDKLTFLEEIHAQGVRDYAQLQKLQFRHPGCDVHYTVCLDGQEYPEDTREVSLTALTEPELELFQYLPQLERIQAQSCTDYDLLMQLKQLHPEYALSYTLSIGAEEYPSDTTTLDITGITDEDIAMIAYLPELEKLHMTDPAADPELLLQMVESRPEVNFSWNTEVLGVSVDNTTTELSFADIAMTEADADILFRTLAYFPALEKVDMTNCGFDNETMAAFREKRRDEYKVVWTVQCGKLTVRTDETAFIPLKHGVYNFQDKDAGNLRYCEDMVALDLGRMMVKDLSFLEYMPHLKYLNLAYNLVQDISPLEHCKELVFLALDRTSVKDYTPLLNCTALEDLNLGRTNGDESIIAQMTWLKNIWWIGGGYSVRVTLEQALPRTHLEFYGSDTSGNGWKNLPNYNAMCDLTGMPHD